MRWLAAALLLLAAPASAHDWFSGETSPRDQSLSCCNGTDCASREVRFADGRFEIQILGRWWDATDSRWYLGDSKTGGWAGCMMPGDNIPRCVWGGHGS